MGNLNTLNDYLLYLENLNHFTNMCLFDTGKGWMISENIGS